LIPFFFITVPSRKRHHACAFAVFFIADAEPEVNRQFAGADRAAPFGILSFSFIFLESLYAGPHGTLRGAFQQIVARLTQFAPHTP
jgi:hypothetical protein